MAVSDGQRPQTSVVGRECELVVSGRSAACVVLGCIWALAYDRVS